MWITFYSTGKTKEFQEKAIGIVLTALGNTQCHRKPTCQIKRKVEINSLLTNVLVPLHKKTIADRYFLKVICLALIHSEVANKNTLCIKGMEIYTPNTYSSFLSRFHHQP